MTITEGGVVFRWLEAGGMESLCGATQGSTGVRQDTEEVGENVGKSLYGGLQSGGWARVGRQA